MKARTGALLALAVAVLNCGAVGIWGFALGASPIVAMPVMAQLTALAAVLLKVDRRVTMAVVVLGVVATLLVAILGAASIGYYLLPAVVLGVVAAVLVGRAGTKRSAVPQST